tara:strand:- start:1039 stop:1266 length:228 start_codon:yes stop_codon:yes gene_type:complete
MKEEVTNEMVHLAEGFFLQERDDGTFALLEDNEVVAEGETVLEALEALEVSLELRMVQATMSWLQASVPEEGYQV